MKHATQCEAGGTRLVDSMVFFLPAALPLPFFPLSPPPRADGQRAFLHPLNVRMLVRLCGSFPKLPRMVTARAVQVNDMVADAEQRRRCKPLGNVPIGAHCYLCELDLSDVLPETVVEAFREETSNREKRRRQLLRRAAAKDKRDTAARDAAQVLLPSAIAPAARPRPEDFCALPGDADGAPEGTPVAAVQGAGSLSYAQLTTRGVGALGPSLPGDDLGRPTPSPGPAGAWGARPGNISMVASSPTTVNAWSGAFDAASAAREGATGRSARQKKKGAKQVLFSSAPRREY